MHPIFNFKHWVSLFEGISAILLENSLHPMFLFVFIHYNTVVVLILRSLATTFGLACKFDT